MLKPVIALLATIYTCDAATPDDIEHVIVIMQENRSFDHYYSDLGNPEYYGSEVDVFDRTKTIQRNAPGSLYPTMTPWHITEENPLLKDPPHLWRNMWMYWHKGALDWFRPYAMGYVTADDIPYYYELANTYAISDRYFSSVMGPTHPNRSYLLAGTSYGLTNNFVEVRLKRHGIQPHLILDEMDDHGKTWGYYTDGRAFVTKMFGKRYAKKSIAQFQHALDTDSLPQVTFLDAVLGKTDEHPKGTPADGMEWVRARIESIQASPVWNKCVIFLTYDESGGFYDHVPPPRTVAPDELKYGLNKTSLLNGWDFTRYGYRVPFMVISPFAKRHYVSHEVADHTSVLRFICERHGLTPLGERAKVAHDLMDMFDFDEM